MPSTVATRSASDFSVLEAMLALPAPWLVAHVELDVERSRVHVDLGHAAGAIWPCPACDARSIAHEYGPARVWRHLDLGRFHTLIRARVPRVQCPRHGVAEVVAPWAGTGSAYTSAMEQHIADLTHRIGVASASFALQIAWEEAWRLMMGRRVGI